MGYIYKITNLKTNKVYIGQTIVSVEERWREHIKNAKNNKRNYLLYQAMRKSGIKNFTIETLEVCANEKLDEREKYWIKKLCSHKHGYNMTEGGNSFIKYLTTEQEEKMWWEDFCNGVSISELARLTGYSRQLISARLSKYPNYKKICKRNIEGKTKPYSQLRKYKRFVFVYDLEGNLIEKTQISSFTIEERESVLACAKGNEKSFNNKLYSFALLSKQDITKMYDRFRERKLFKKPIYDLIELYKIRTLNKEEKRSLNAREH